MTGLIKTKVCEGVYWVEAPEVDLRMLCGCPADAVKHLFQRGFILIRESGGVSYETGPTSILLSDVPVQNGMFANMSEFPVLQMLYRQGMILPGHPNNTGAKPLIVGSEDQVRAQMEYIRRGNYGLTSEEEILASGVPADTAREMMRLKLKFAFGNIRDTRELLDSRVVTDEPVELTQGVHIRRLRMNVFEVEYKGETVTVDLNLAPEARYPAPFTLGNHLIPREYFAVVHSGDGDGWDYTRPCMASVVMFQGRIYLIDSGPNLLYALCSLGIGVNEIEGVFHTHAHDDHFCGLAALMRSDRRLKYYATPPVRASVTKKLSALTSIREEDFDRFFDVRDLKAEEWNDIDGMEVRPVFSPHPVETTILFFRALGSDGPRTYAHLADIGALTMFRKWITDDPEAPGLSQALYDRVEGEYLQPADVKKLDAGGGMIHGDPTDFRDDASGKVILSHLARQLTTEEKEIGSGATFGMIDTLIPGHQEYLRRSAVSYLETFFPTAPEWEIRMLANNPLEVFNPETILLKRGDTPRTMYLILSGSMEMLCADQGREWVLSAGSLAGEIAGTTQSPSHYTLRALNFVQALCIPCDLYLEFVKRNGLFARLRRLQNRREFLQSTWLLGDSVSSPVQTSVARTMRLRRRPAGAEIAPENNSDLVLIQKGTACLLMGEEIVETLEPGDFFNEGGALFGASGIFQVQAQESMALYHLPGKLLRDIPIVRWKLQETYERRMYQLLCPESNQLADVPSNMKRP